MVFRNAHTSSSKIIVYEQQQLVSFYRLFIDHTDLISDISVLLQKNTRRNNKLQANIITVYASITDLLRTKVTY